MKASVIVLSWNGMDYLEDCLDAVFSQDYDDFEVIVVDNGSTDGSADFVAGRFPQAQLIRNERNLGFAAGNNVGLRAATGDVLALLNQDTVVHEGWLVALVAALEDPAVGFVGCKLLYPDGTIQHAGGRLVGVRGESEHTGRHEPDTGQYDQPREVDFVTGAAIALRRSTLARIGLLDEGFAPAYFEDVDWCYRAREAGLRVMYWPAATLIHYESVSIQMDSYAHKAVYHHGRLRLLFKHKPLSWLQQEFAPAEVDGIRQMGRISEMMAVRDAYLRLMLSLPEILVFRLRSAGKATDQGAREEWEALLALISGLRDACVPDDSQETLYAQLEHTEDHAVGTRILKEAASMAESTVDAGATIPESAPAEPEPVPTMIASELSQAELPAEPFTERLIPEHLLADLHTQWQIQEQPFHSDVPIVGSSIAAFRQAWNNVAARWYVLPLLQQQNDFNQTVTNLMTEIIGQQTEMAAQQTEMAAQQTEMTIQQNEVAVTQIAMLHIMRQLLNSVKGQRRDSAQSMREIDKLTLAIMRLQERIEVLEKLAEE